MTGNRLRELLTLGNVSIKGLAEKLNMTQPNLSAQFKVQDVKSGILERICEVLGVTMDFFYGGTKYMKNGGEGYVAKEETVGVAQEEDAAILYKKRQQSLADAKDQEIIFLKGQVQALKETIQMLGGKNSNVDVPMPLQKKRRIARNGNHIQPDRANTSHGLQLFQSQRATLHGINHTLVFTHRNKGSAQPSHV